MVLLTGAITTATHNIIRGWTQEESSHRDGTALSIFIDDEFYFEFYTNAKYIPEGKEHLFFSGKEFQFLWELPLRSVKVSIYFRENGQELLNSPLYIHYNDPVVPLFIEDYEKYIEETCQWLDQRFGQGYNRGIYIGHQPIYGYRAGYCDIGNLINRYLVTFHIINALSRLSFNSFLDVGGAEGYKAAMVAHFFGSDVTSSDVSQEACNRAEELYGIKTAIANAHSLPFEDEQFDIVLSSESLEHIPDYKKSLQEILRVSKKVAIITVPHESQVIVQKTIESGDLHGHIQYFDIYSFEYLRQLGYEVFIKKILLREQKLLVPGLLMECESLTIPNIPNNQLRRIATKLPGLMRLIFNKFVVAPILEQDGNSIKSPELFYGGVLAIIIKDKTMLNDNKYLPVSVKKIKMLDVINFIVPYLSGSDDGITAPSEFKEEKIKYHPLLPRPYISYGCFDAVNESRELHHNIRRNNGIQLNGWAILPKPNRSADQVLITSTENKILIATAPVNQPRQDVVQALNNSQYAKSGWIVNIPVESLPAPELEIQAWAYNSKTREAFPLNNLHHLTLEN